MRKAKIDSNQRVIVHGLREAGCSVESLASLGRGVPDLLVGFRGVTYLLEVKSSGGKLNSCQKGWHEKWRGQVAVVQSLDEAKRVVGL